MTAALATKSRLAPVPVCVQDRGSDPADSTTLWALTSKQRVEAMWAGKLTFSQLNEWTRRRPTEVPLLGNEFAWLIMRTDEWDDMTLEQQAHARVNPNNVVELPQRKELHRVAA